MASEIRVDKINSLSGVGTVTLSPTGVDIAGITTAATLRATTGIVTSLTAGSLTSLGAVSGTTGTFSGAVSGTTGTFSAAVSGTTGTFSGAVSGTTGTFTGDVDIADKIIHTGDTNTAIRFPEADTITFETAGFEQVRIDNDVQMFVEANSKQAKLQLHREDTSVAADDVIGQITFTGRDSGGAGTQRVGAAISAIASNAWDTGQATGYSPAHLDFFTQNNSGVETTLTSRLRIDSDGRCIVGGGSHAGGSALVVKGGNQNNYSTVGMFSNHTNPSSGTLLSQIRFGANATAVGADIRVYADADWGSSDYPSRMEFHTTPDGSSSKQVRLKIDKDGDVIVSDGDLVIGTSGHGISFAATGDGNQTMGNELLDDYEEGTWTPVPSQYFGGAISASYTVQTGFYVRVGKLVHVEFRLHIGSVTNNGSNIPYLDGLPYLPDANRSYHAAGSIGYNSAFTNDYVSTCFVHPDFGGCIYFTEDGRTANISTSVWQGGQLFGSIVYMSS